MTDWMPNVANLPMDIVKDGIDWSPLPEERSARAQRTIPSDGKTVRAVQTHKSRRRANHETETRKATYTVG